jgi:hypothetical protein
MPEAGIAQKPKTQRSGLWGSDGVPRCWDETKRYVRVLGTGR